MQQSSMQIYLARNNEQAGPYTLEQVNAMLANTQIVLTDLAWHEGMPNWLPLGQLTGGKLVYNPPAATMTRPFSPASQTQNAYNQPEQFYSAFTLANGATLASVGKRIGAALVDYFLINFAFFISFASTMTLEQIVKFNANIFNQFISLFTNTTKPDAQQMMSSIYSSIPQQTTVTVIVSLLILTLFQIWLITSRGQTIGKILFNIRIVDNISGQKSTFMRSVLLRSVLVKYIGYYGIGILVFIVDFIFLFTSQNRTLHDRLAKTVVVNARPDQLPKSKP